MPPQEPIIAVSTTSPEASSTVTEIMPDTGNTAWRIGSPARPNKSPCTKSTRVSRPRATGYRSISSVRIRFCRRKLLPKAHRGATVMNPPVKALGSNGHPSVATIRILYRFPDTFDQQYLTPGRRLICARMSRRAFDDAQQRSSDLLGHSPRFTACNCEKRTERPPAGDPLDALAFGLYPPPMSQKCRLGHGDRKDHAGHRR